MELQWMPSSPPSPPWCWCCRWSSTSPTATTMRTRRMKTTRTIITTTMWRHLITFSSPWMRMSQRPPWPWWWAGKGSFLFLLSKENEVNTKVRWLSMLAKLAVLDTAWETFLCHSKKAVSSLNGLSHQKFLDLYFVQNAQDHDAHGPDLDKPCFPPQIHIFLCHTSTSCHWDLVTVSNWHHWETVTVTISQWLVMDTVKKFQWWLARGWWRKSWFWGWKRGLSSLGPCASWSWAFFT